MAEFPAQGDKKPWQLYQNYIKDMLTLRFAKLDDGVLKFARKGEAVIPLPANSDSATPLVHAAE